MTCRSGCSASNYSNPPADKVPRIPAESNREILIKLAHCAERTVPRAISYVPG